MLILRIILKILSFITGCLILLTQWLLVMLLGFSAPVCLLLAFLLLLVAGISGLAGLVPAQTVIGVATAGFVVFLIPVGGQHAVFAIDNIKDRLRNIANS